MWFLLLWIPIAIIGFVIRMIVAGAGAGVSAISEHNKRDQAYYNARNGMPELAAQGKTLILNEYMQNPNKHDAWMRIAQEHDWAQQMVRRMLNGQAPATEVLWMQTRANNAREVMYYIQQMNPGLFATVKSVEEAHQVAQQSPEKIIRLQISE